MTQPTLFDQTMPQWEKVLWMLRTGSKTTADFCGTPGLAAEYRRAISELRRKGYQVQAVQVGKGRWEYTLTENKVA